MRKKIKLSDLRKAINSIFDHLQDEMNCTSISLQHDFYRELSYEDRYNPDALTKENPELLIGQLYDDWEFLENMLKDKSECHPMLGKAASLLNYISHKDYDELKRN